MGMVRIANNEAGVCIFAPSPRFYKINFLYINWNKPKEQN